MISETFQQANQIAETLRDDMKRTVETLINTMRQEICETQQERANQNEQDHESNCTRNINPAMSFEATQLAILQV